MTVVRDTIHSVSLSVIPKRVAEYQALIDNAEPLFELNGLGLEDACKQHAQNLMMYDLMYQECRTVEDSVRARVEEVEALLFRKYHEGQQRALNATEIKQYIRGDTQYVTAYEILLEVVTVKRKLEAVVEALKSMGWSLNNIVKLRVAQLDHITL